MVDWLALDEVVLEVGFTVGGRSLLLAASHGGGAHSSESDADAGKYSEGDDDSFVFTAPSAATTSAYAETAATCSGWHSLQVSLPLPFPLRRWLDEATPL